LGEIATTLQSAKAAAAKAGYNLKEFLNPATSMEAPEPEPISRISADPVAHAVKLPGIPEPEASSDLSTLEASLESSKA
jgi:hypothetical protein